MNYHSMKRLILANSRGGVLLIVALFLFVFIGIAALAIDIGYLSTSRNELQNAADAAALGATRKLGNIYQIMAQAGQNIGGYDVNTNGDKAAIIAIAKYVAGQNKAASVDVKLDSEKNRSENGVAISDIQIGFWDFAAVPPTFTERDVEPNAVRVTAYRDDTNESGPISTFFARAFGINFMPVSTRATAALSGQGTSTPGELEIPIGLSEKWFYDDAGNPKDFCGDIVKFHPTTDPEACAGWTSFNQTKTNPSDGLLPTNKNTINNIIDGSYQGETAVGNDFGFNNGVSVSDLFRNMLALYGSKGDNVDRFYTPTSGDPQKITSGPSKPLCLYNDVVGECLAGDEPTLPDPGYVKGEAGTILRYPSSSDSNNANPFTGELRYAHEWKTTVPVYSAEGDLTTKSSCTPGLEKLIGYVSIILYNIGGPSDPYIWGRVSCDEASPEATSGGGAYFGILGTIPNLVE